MKELKIEFPKAYLDKLKERPPFFDRLFDKYDNLGLTTEQRDRLEEAINESNMRISEHFSTDKFDLCLDFYIDDIISRAFSEDLKTYVTLRLLEASDREQLYVHKGDGFIKNLLVKKDYAPVVYDIEADEIIIPKYYRTNKFKYFDNSKYIRLGSL